MEHRDAIQERMRRMDALFNRIFGYDVMPSLPSSPFLRTDLSEPAADVYESETEFILHVALPGVAPEDIRIEATDESILLTAQRHSPFVGGQRASGELRGETAASTGVDAAIDAPSGPPPVPPTGAPTSEPTNIPHTQHRHSGAFEHSSLRFAYTFPTPINPAAASANFRHGMLELRLQKRPQTGTRTVTIKVETVGAEAPQPPMSPPANAPQRTTATSADSAAREGNPNNKMGSAFVPSAGEDHTMQAQSIGARTEHQPGRDVTPIATGQTNPLAATNPGSTNEPTEPQRPR